MVNKTTEEENNLRLIKARKTISNNPETQLINASKAGDAVTVKRLLEHVYDLPKSRIKEDNFILLRDEAYNLAFNAASKELNLNIIKDIINYAPDKISKANIIKTLYKTATINPNENPEAKYTMNLLLDKEADKIPKALLETAKRLRTAYNEDLDRATHIRKNFSQFISFYVTKEETTKKVNKQDKKLKKIDYPFKIEESKKKIRPNYIRPI